MWIRAPAKEKQFEEYVVFYAMDYADSFYSCLTEDCAKVREQNDNDVLNYIAWALNDSFMVRQYYTMEEYFESKLSTLDFRHWKRNNEHWKEGYNWQFKFQANDLSGAILDTLDDSTYAKTSIIRRSNVLGRGPPLWIRAPAKKSKA